jgi:hypothetical protein
MPARAVDLGQSAKRPPPTAEEALALLAERKEAKNAKARAKTAARREASLQAVADAADVVGQAADQLDPSAPNDFMEAVLQPPSQLEGRALSKHLLEQFNKASTKADVSEKPEADASEGQAVPAARERSSFTKQAAGILTAIHAKVTSGPVSAIAVPPTAVTPPLDSADDDGTSDGLSEIGGNTFEPIYGAYVQVKISSASFAKGRIMQVQKSKGNLYTLLPIGPSSASGAKKANVDIKSLQVIDRNAENLQEYLNLRVANPTLPEVPPLPSCLVIC